MAGVCVAVEVLSSLQLCNASLLLPEHLAKDDIHKVISDASGFVVQLTDGRTLRVDSPKSVQYKAGEREYTFVSDRLLNIRLTLDTRTSIVTSIVSDLANDIRSLYIKSPYDVLCGRPLLVACTGCSAVVSKVITFDRIRAMPATDWDHASEEWFCCAHGSTNFDKLKPGGVTPKLNDCFFSDLYFLLKEGVLLDCAHRYDCNGNAVCSSCNDIFGVRDKTGVKLWAHRIRWLDSKDGKTVLYSRTEQKLLTTLIDNLSVDSFGVNSRVVFVKPTKPKMFLYLAVMDTNLTLLTTSSNSSANCHQTTEVGTVSSLAENTPQQNGDNCSKGKRVRSSDVAKKNRTNLFDEAGSATVTLNKNSVIKVLFRHVSGETHETGLWADDVNVHLFPCAESLFDAVYEQLTDSAAGLVAAVEEGDMKVGYIAR